MKKLLFSDYKNKKLIADNLAVLNSKKYIDISDEEYTRVKNAAKNYTGISTEHSKDLSYILAPESGNSITEKIVKIEKNIALSFVDLYSRMGVLETTTASYINNYLNNIGNIKNNTVELVRSDWTESDPTSYAYIINKPVIPVIPTETTLSYELTGIGNAVTNISVNNHKILLTRGSYFLTDSNLGNSLKTINNQSIVGSGNVTLSGLPEVTALQNGKTLMVVNGQWAMISPATFYSGSGVPNDINGNDGDIYIQTNS